MAYPKKTYTKKPAGKATNNKQKQARAGFKAKTANYKADHQSAVCCTFIDTIATIDQSISNTKISEGFLANDQAVVATAGSNEFTISASIALDSDATIMASHRHGTLKQMFNEFNTSAIYLDLLFSPELRANADQVFLLVERGIEGKITSVSQMLSDVNCKMYQLGNNTQKLSFKHIFNTAQDRINKKTHGREIAPTETYYLKILCKGKNVSPNTLEVGDAQIKLRAKMYNKYRDMKALSNELQPKN